MFNGMSEHWLKQAESWHEFYLLVGSAGAALLGLMFVVVSLGPSVVSQRQQSVRAFCTPIIVDFTSALVVSALMMVPGFAPPLLGVALASSGFAGLIYQFSTGAHGQWRQNKLPAIDWIWFVGLQYFGYGVVLAAAIAIWQEKFLGLYAVASAALLFVIIGIRNSWDLVLWFAERARSS
jgi:hypothetical protein